MLATGPWYRRPDTPLLVGHLMASAPPRSRAAAAGSGALALLLHASVLTLALTISAGPVRHTLTTPSAEIFLPVVPVDQPAPPPPPTAASGGTSESAGIPGFKVLPPPTFTATDIPPIRAGVVVNEANYVGWGTPGGSATGARVPTPVQGVNIEDAPVFTPVAIAPELRNRAAVERALRQAYPALLRDAGVTGRVLVWVLVDEAGRSLKVLLKQSSGVPALDDAALGVARLMRFSPGINHDAAVRVWVALPIDFRVHE